MRARRVLTAFRALSLRTFDRLDCVANAKINLRHSLYIARSSCSDLTNTVRSRSQARSRGSAMYIAATHKCSAGIETSSL